MIDLISILEAIEQSRIYLIALSFFAWYPLVSSGVLVLVSLTYFLRRERKSDEILPALDPEYTPVEPVTT